jgi:glycosyltransferase 2 family protein
MHISRRNPPERLRNCHICVSNDAVDTSNQAVRGLGIGCLDWKHALNIDWLQKKSRGSARIKGLGGAAVSIAIAAGAIFALTHALRNIDYENVFAIIWSTDGSVIALALVMVTLSYASITLYDWLALHTMGRKDVPYRIAALASFTSYPIAHGIGAVALISPVIRYRIYSRNGLGAMGVANICFLTGLTFWLGNMTALGFSLLYQPAAIGVIDHLPPWANRLLALLLLGCVGAFLAWSWLHPRQVGRSQWLVKLPSGPLVLLQILVGLLDLTAAATALYVLLPAGVEVSFFRTLAVFIAATLLGFASHAPAGLGVFDATILIGLGDENREQLLAALLMFRFLYHLVPLSIALLLFGGVETWRNFRAKKSPANREDVSDGRVELEPDHTGHDQRQADDANRISRLAKQHHADEDAADSADPGPYRIRRAERQ